MLNKYRILVLVIFMLASAANVWAEQVKAYVSHFSVTGAANKEELKPVLQTLLMSRLSGDSILAVDNAESAEVIISGSYIAFGKIFSIDATARSSSGNVIIRAFEQGESQEDMLAAVGKIANSLAVGISKYHVKGSASEKIASALELKAAAVVAKPEPALIPADIVRAETSRNRSPSTWISQKLEGELVGISPGRQMGEKGRELFVAGKHKLQYFQLAKEMTLQAEVSLPVNQNILGIDTVDLNGDGIFEIYLTVMNGENIASQVWSADGSYLKKTGDNVQYFFRSITSNGQRKLYAQQVGQELDYFGDLYEVARKGGSLQFIKPLKLPAGCNIYNVNIISPEEGKTGFVTVNSDGYLVIFNDKREELWKSSEKYGGSENFYSKEDLQNMRITGSPNRKTFLEQRIFVTKSGEIIVPKNDGFFVMGDSRSFTKNSLYAFKWNGASLEELWHTRQSQNYLADYIYDDELKELLLLEVVKKEGILAKGASAVSIKKVE